MDVKKISVLLLFLVALALFSFPQNHQDTMTQDYQTVLAKYRKGKNIKLMYMDSSPLTAEQKKSFKGLNYYPANELYNVIAILVTNKEWESITMKTKTERTAEYIRYGQVYFEIEGVEQSLVVYQSKKLKEIDDNKRELFIPFRDGTSGAETYGGGRYIDSEIPTEGNTIMLDFNKAYNPYCAYNAKYSCVIPPEENQLQIRIEAGEQKFEENH